MKKLLPFLIVIILYVIYANFVFKPETLFNFSLIDDGQLVKYGRYLNICVIGHDCLSFKNNIIDMLPDVGLSRIGSWIIHGVLYQGIFVNPQFQHMFRVYGIGGLIVILFFIVTNKAKAHPAAIIFSTALLVTSFSFSENLIRLGPIEPYLIIFIAFFSLFFLEFEKYANNSRVFAYLSLYSLLIYLLLIKEVSIAIVPVTFLTGLTFPKIIKWKNLFSLIIVSCCVYLLAKLFLQSSIEQSDYAQNYNTNIFFIFNNSINYINMVRSSLNPYVDYLIILTPFLLLDKKMRHLLYNKYTLFWFFIVIFFTGILFPWKYVYDRYILPTVFGFCVLFAIFLGEIIKKAENYLHNSQHKLLFNFALLFILPNLFFIGATENIARGLNYRHWFGIFTQFEHEQVKSLSELKDNLVYLNAKDTMDNWEVSYEIPIHLKYFYHSDLEIRDLKDTSTKGIVFSRSLFDPFLNVQELGKIKYRVLERKEYDIAQIDTFKFNSFFRMLPLQTLRNPPISDDKIIYYWEIGKIE